MTDTRISKKRVINTTMLCFDEYDKNNINLHSENINNTKYSLHIKYNNQWYKISENSTLKDIYKYLNNFYTLKLTLKYNNELHEVSLYHIQGKIFLDFSYKEYDYNFIAYDEEEKGFYMMINSIEYDENNTRKYFTFNEIYTMINNKNEFIKTIKSYI